MRIIRRRFRFHGAIGRLERIRRMRVIDDRRELPATAQIPSCPGTPLKFMIASAIIFARDTDLPRHRDGERDILLIEIAHQKFFRGFALKRTHRAQSAEDTA